jgi:hypothetical protein
MGKGLGTAPARPLNDATSYSISTYTGISRGVFGGTNEAKPPDYWLNARCRTVCTCTQSASVLALLSRLF